MVFSGYDLFSGLTEVLLFCLRTAFGGGLFSDVDGVFDSFLHASESIMETDFLI